MISLEDKELYVLKKEEGHAKLTDCYAFTDENRENTVCLPRLTRLSTIATLFLTKLCLN